MFNFLLEDSTILKTLKAKRNITLIKFDTTENGNGTIIIESNVDYNQERELGREIQRGSEN